MKKKYVLIILASIVLGILIGGMIKDLESMKKLYVSKDDIAKRELKITNRSIKKLKNEKKDLDKKRNDLIREYTDINDIKKIDYMKDLLSYTDIKGKGITIIMDSLNEDIGNIANMIDYNKILINLINELKINGGEFISINGQRINQYSAIVLAGNHININSIPIAQPYEIKVIGDVDKLSSYLNEKNNYIDNIILNYPIKLEYEIKESINMPKIEIPNNLRYIREG